MKKNESMIAVMQILVAAEQSLADHRINHEISARTLSKAGLDMIIKCLYADGVWWVSGLRYMLKRARNKRFIQALSDNLACETGYSGGSAHMVLLDDFIESICLKIDMNDPIYRDATKRAQQENLMLKKATEPQKAGFMLATEHIFPKMLQVIRPAVLDHYPKAIMNYIDEHIEVDADEHAIWMQESVEQIIAESEEYTSEIMEEMNNVVLSSMYPLDIAIGASSKSLIS